MFCHNEKIKNALVILLAIGFVFGLFYLAKPVKTQAQTPPQVCNNNSACEGAENEENCPSDCAGKVLSPEAKSLMDQIWQNRGKNYYLASIDRNFDSTHRNPYVLYEIQISIQNILDYARYAKDYQIMDDFAYILDAAYNKMNTQDYYIYRWPWPVEDGEVCNRSVTRTIPATKMWTYLSDPNDPLRQYMYEDGFEDHYVSIQFLYMVSDAINIYSGIEPSQRTAKMNEVISKYSPLIINDHYMRWIYDDRQIYQVKGWNCEGKCTTPNYNNYDFLQNKLNNYFGHNEYHPYCNLMNDFEMQLVAGVAQILGANRKNPAGVPLTAEQKQQFSSYIDLATRYLEARLTESDLRDFNNNPVKGLNLDLNAWDTHSAMDYSGYTGLAFPTEADKSRATNAGWDISHARRFVYLFNSLLENKSATEQTWPDEEVLKKLTNQLVYGTFNRDLKKPLFTNFMGGVNGWYRVNYNNRLGFGYAPSDLSISIPTGGYGFWAKYNPDLAKIMASLWHMLTVDMPTDYGQHYSNYQKVGGFSYNRTNSISYLAFIPTLAATCGDDCPNLSNLSITKTVDKSSASSGQTLIYTLQVKNNGSTALSNINVTDPIPANTTYVAGSANEGGQLQNNIVTWIFSLAPGEVKNLRFQVKIN